MSITFYSQPSQYLRFPEGAVLGIDTETTGLTRDDQIILLQISNGTDTVVIHSNCLVGANLEKLRSLFTDPRKLYIMQYAGFDYPHLARKLGTWDLFPRIFDTKLAEQVLYAGDPTHSNSLKNIALRILGEELDKEVRLTFDSFDVTEEQIMYAAKDAEILIPIMQQQVKELIESNLVDTAKLEFDLTKTVARMEDRGALIDVDRWSQVIESYVVREEGIRSKLFELADTEFNPRSPKQVLELLQKHGVPVESTNFATLLPHRQKFPIVDTMMELREVATMIDRYGKKWLDRIGPDKRIRAEFNQMGTTTGRFSSSNPNLQQIPRGSELRAAFIAPEGKYMISADYSQIELRLLAEFSKDQTMLDMFEAGEDIHKLTATNMFNKSLDQITDRERYLAKTLNFSLMYGSGPKKLKDQMLESGVEISVKDAKQLISKYFQVFSGVNEWLTSVERKTLEELYMSGKTETRTKLGRRRVYTVSSDSAEGEMMGLARQAKNAIIQGTSADIMKGALIELDNIYPDSVLMTVHDEVVMEMDSRFDPNEAAESVKAIMSDAAREYMKLCPVDVSVNAGSCWSK